MTKRIKDIIDGVYDIDEERKQLKAAQAHAKYEAMPEKDLERELKRIEKEMLDAARNLEFEKAAELRDRLYQLKEKLFGVSLALSCTQAHALNDSEYALRWRTLAAQLRELERVAGIADAASIWRDAMPLPTRPAHETEAMEPTESMPQHPHLFPLGRSTAAPASGVVLQRVPRGDAQGPHRQAARTGAFRANGDAHPPRGRPEATPNRSGVGHRKGGGSRPSSARAW